MPALASTTAWALPGILGDGVGVSPSWASGLLGTPWHSPKEPQWHLLRWLKVGHLHGHQQPASTPLLSRRGTKRTPIVNIETPLRDCCNSHQGPELPLPVTNITAEQPMGIKHSIQHMGQCQLCVFSPKPKKGLKPPML